MSFSFFFLNIQIRVAASSTIQSSRLILFASCDDSSEDGDRRDDDGVVEYDCDIYHRCFLFLFSENKSRKLTLTNGSGTTLEFSVIGRSSIVRV